MDVPREPGGPFCGINEPDWEDPCQIAVDICVLPTTGGDGSQGGQQCDNPPEFLPRGRLQPRPAPDAGPGKNRTEERQEEKFTGWGLRGPQKELAQHPDRVFCAQENSWEQVVLLEVPFIRD